MDPASKAPNSQFPGDIQQRLEEIDRLPPTLRAEANEKITDIFKDLLDQGNHTAAFEVAKRISKTNTPSSAQVLLQSTIVDRLREEGKLQEAVAVARKIPNFGRLGDAKQSLIRELKQARMPELALEMFNLFSSLNTLRTSDDQNLIKLFNAMDEVDRESVLHESEQEADQKYEEIAHEFLSLGHLQATTDISYKMTYTNYQSTIRQQLVNRFIDQDNFQAAKDVALTIPFYTGGAINYYTEFMHILRQNGAEEEANEVREHLAKMNALLNQPQEKSKYEPNKLI